eukprot:TRINITY_DN1559_c2_g1_i1.p1 TRINITY_DN1559_c2_g1~~TRINITY_DN1559_c2_g1_i1.p1  ORF type:complete len:319 (+),score=41.77 TRINITY_DN1559_c2_g1_i1:223-1179(+)
MFMLVTREFIFIAKENGGINRAVWLQDVEAVYTMSTKILVKTKSGSPEPGLILMSKEGDMRNNPQDLTKAAETMVHAISASTGTKVPLVRLELGGNKPFINMQKSKSYMKPHQKLKLLRQGGGFKPKRYPPGAGSPGQPFATAPPAGGTVSLVEEPAPPTFPMVTDREKEKEKEKESPPLPPARKASITPDEAGNLDQYVFAPQPPSPTHRSRPHHSPSRQQKRLSLQSRKASPPPQLSRVGSVPSYSNRHSGSSSPLKRHSSSRKDGFWKEFVRDYDALEKQWEADQEKRRSSISLGSPRDKRISRRMSQELQWAAV